MIGAGQIFVDFKWINILPFLFTIKNKDERILCNLCAIDNRFLVTVKFNYLAEKIKLSLQSSSAIFMAN